MNIMLSLLIAAGSLFAQYAPPSKPFCTTAITANCVPSTDATALLATPSFVTSLPSGTPGSFARFYDTTAKPMAQKTLVLFGNSIVQAANELFTQLATYAASGKALDGMTVSPVNLDGSSGWVINAGNILNRGVNGALLSGMLADSTIPNLCAQNPDGIIILGPLMNDVRNGALTLDQARNLIRQMLDKVTACAPWADIMLVTEPSLLTTDPGSFGWVTPATAQAAQVYSTMIHDAATTFAGAYPHLSVLDTQAGIFGLTAPATSPYMLNQLHPGPAGRTAEADLIAGFLAALKYKPLFTQLPGAGSNLLPYSTDFSHWSLVGSPTLSTTGNQITATTTGGESIFQEISGMTPGATYTFSFYAKKGTSTDARYSVYDPDHSAFVLFTISYFGSLSATQWTRVTATFTVPAGCTHIRVYPYGAPGVGQGTIFVDRLMVNAGSTALPWVKGTIQ